MNELTFSDIFIGENGIVVLVSAMVLAFIGNTFKKYKRYQSRPDKSKGFSFNRWIKDNLDEMVFGFIATYILVRLIGFVAEYAFQAAGVSEHTTALSPEDSIFLVSVLIGYYIDPLLKKLLK
jgi:hypothetical protein